MYKIIEHNSKKFVKIISDLSYYWWREDFHFFCLIFTLSIFSNFVKFARPANPSQSPNFAQVLKQETAQTKQTLHPFPSLLPLTSRTKAHQLTIH